MDAWFAGYQPGLTAVVWIGHDNPKKLGDRETGGGLSLPVWIDYMAQALKGTAVAESSPPAGVVNIGGEWYFEEFSGSQGVSSLTGDEHLPNKADDAEKKGILDLFR
ncbi:MAG: penicillin-binding protein, partial [Ideonella sp.]